MLDAWFGEFRRPAQARRSAQSRPAPTRRAHRAGGRPARGSETRPAQRVTGHRDRHRPPCKTFRPMPGMRSPPAAHCSDPGSDPDGHSRRPLSGALRRGGREVTVAGPLQTDRLGRSANHAARQVPWLHPPRLHVTGLPQRSPPRHQRLETRRPHRHRRPHPGLPTPTTYSSKTAAGTPENSPTATPNGSHHQISRCTAAPTTTTTPNAYSPKTTKRTRAWHFGVLGAGERRRVGDLLRHSAAPRCSARTVRPPAAQSLPRR